MEERKKQKILNNLIISGLVLICVFCVLILIRFVSLRKDNESNLNSNVNQTNWHFGSDDASSIDLNGQEKEGDFYINTETLTIYQYTNGAWNTSNLILNNNQSVQTGQNGDTGVGLAEIYEDWEYDEETNKLYMVYTVKLTNGDTIQAGKVLIDKCVIGMELEEKEFYACWSLRPKAIVKYSDGSSNIVDITDDMYVTDDLYEKPNFDIAKKYTVKINYLGFELLDTIQVVESTGKEIKVEVVDSDFLPFIYKAEVYDYDDEWDETTYKYTINMDFLPVDFKIVTPNSLEYINVQQAYLDQLLTLEWELISMYYPREASIRVGYRKNIEDPFMYTNINGYPISSLNTGDVIYDTWYDIVDTYLMLEKPVITKSVNSIKQLQGEPLPLEQNISVEFVLDHYGRYKTYASWNISIPFSEYTNSNNETIDENTPCNDIYTCKKYSSYIDLDIPVSIYSFDNIIVDCISKSTFYLYYGDPDGEIYDWAAKDYQIEQLKNTISRSYVYLYLNKYIEFEGFKTQYDVSKGLFYILYYGFDVNSVNFDAIDFDYGTTDCLEFQISLVSGGKTYEYTVAYDICFDPYDI